MPSAARLFLTLALGLFASSAQAETKLTLLTENAPPGMWQEPDGSLHGDVIELVGRMMKRAGIEYSIAILPWPRAYHAAQVQADTCVFAAAMVGERIGAFKWVHPLERNTLNFYAKPGAPPARSLEEAQRLGLTVGVVKGDVTETLLSPPNGLKLDAVPSAHLNLRKLAAGRIDLWAEVASAAPVEAAEEKVEIALAFQTSPFELGMGCNKSVDDQTINRLNRALADSLAGAKPRK